MLAAPTIVQGQILFTGAEGERRDAQGDEKDHRHGQASSCYSAEHRDSLPRLGEGSIPSKTFGWETFGLISGQENKMAIDGGNAFRYFYKYGNKKRGAGTDFPRTFLTPRSFSFAGAVRKALRW